MAKHGIDNFQFDIIEYCSSQAESNYQEAWHIKIYCSHISTNMGYNVSLGGNVESPMPETVAKIKATKDSWSPETKAAYSAKIAATLTGVKHTDERRKNQSLSHIGIPTWNKGTKGVMKAKSTSFKPGLIPWNKGMKGLSANNSKLTDDNVIEIFSLYHNENYSKQQLMVMFGISDRVTRNIIAGRTWSHITNIIPKSKT